MVFGPRAQQFSRDRERSKAAKARQICDASADFVDHNVKAVVVRCPRSDQGDLAQVIAGKIKGGSVGVVTHFVTDGLAGHRPDPPGVRTVERPGPCDDGPCVVKYDRVGPGEGCIGADGHSVMRVHVPIVQQGASRTESCPEDSGMGRRQTHRSAAELTAVPTELETVRV